MLCFDDDYRVHALALCGLIALQQLLIIFIVVAAAVTPGYSHVSNTVSQLGSQDRPYPWIMNTGFIIYGLLIIAT